MTFEIICADSAATENFGRQIGERLEGGEVIELVGDVGSGKTTFVRGIANGAGSRDHVSSPTFVIRKVYSSPKVIIHHFDFYRLSEPELIKHELADALSGTNDVVVIEWSDIIADVLPDKLVRIDFENQGEQRKLKVTAPESLQYLLEKS